MNIIRQYRMAPVDERFDDLVAALCKLAGTLRDLPGCKDVMILGAPDRSEVSFIEVWASREDHLIGGKSLPENAFTEVMSLVASRPESSTWDVVTPAAKTNGR